MFRAYATAADEEKEDGECEDHDCEDTFSSFDQAKVLEARDQRDRRAKEERIAEKIKDLSALRYIESDTDEDAAQINVLLPKLSRSTHVTSVELPVTKVKKKLKLHKRKRKRKVHKSKDKYTSSHSDLSSDCSSASDHNRERKNDLMFSFKKEKWDFLVNGEERSLEGSYIVFHKTCDHENFHMHCIPKGHTTEYGNRFYTVLNGNERLNELFFSKEFRELRRKMDRFERYYSGQLRNLDETTAERKFRKLPSLCETNTDFVALSRSKLQDFHFLHEIAECKTSEKQRCTTELELTMSSGLVALETQRRLIATEFSKNSKNGDLLDQFLRINEEIYSSNRAQGMTVDRKPLVERQISILDQAITCNPRIVNYRLKRLHYLKEICSTNEMLSEWEKILNAFVNNCSVWEKYLDFIQYDMTLYQNSIMDKAFDRCFSKLGAILSGTFRSHKPEANTKLFLLNTYVRRLMWWMECGFTNRAVASVQATFEYNFQRPISLYTASEQKSMEAFTEFWNSGVPRFGDLEAKGWAKYYSKSEESNETCDFELVEREAQIQQISHLEEKIGSSPDDSVMSWVEMERVLDNIESRPRRRLMEKYTSLRSEESLHAQKEIAFEDIRILTCCCENAVFTLLRSLGAQFGKSLSYSLFYQNDQLLSCSPTFHMLEEWGLLPPSKKLFSIPSEGARNIVLKMIYAVTKLQPSMEFVVSLLETKASQVDCLFSDRPTGIHITSMRDFLREVMNVFKSVEFGMPREEFEFAVGAYTLNMFVRWVREEDVEMVYEAKQRLISEHKRKQKKMKRGDRQFTSSQYIEKLKEFLYMSINTPILLLGPIRLQILLRTLLSLVQVVPCSSVLGVITRFLLRKDDREKLSPTDILAALDEWKQLFRTLENFSKPLSCFESSRALCIALRIHFDYARASQNSDQWLEECENLFQLSTQCHAPDDRSIILSAYLDVLERNWKHRHTGKSKLLDTLEKGQNICPHDGSVIRRYINTFSNGGHKIRLRRLFSNGISANDNRTLDLCRSLTLIYFERHRAMKLQDAGVPINKDVIAAVTRSEASRKMDPALWRLAMAYAKDKRFIDETHVLASGQCGWSRHLHIDYVASCCSRKKCIEIINLMEERGAHVFNYLDYIDVLKQATDL